MVETRFGCFPSNVSQLLPPFSTLISLLSMLNYPTVRLKAGKESSVKRFHPWIFSGAIAEQDKVEEGQLVQVLGHDGRFLAVGQTQIGSIAVRLLTFQAEQVDAPFWRERIQQALHVRRQIGLWHASDTNMFRLVHGEGDGLPGLIVDIYDRVAVLQCHTVGMYHQRMELAQAIMESLAPRLEAVYDKSAHTLPFKAPVDPVDAYLIGSPQIWQAQESGNRYTVDVEKGQKTGFFVDQRENRFLLGTYAEGKSVLNTFCYTGGFSVAALRGGAKEVVSLDSSALAMELTEANVRQNFGHDVPHESVTDDAFTYLRNLNKSFDIIVLDPPAFAKHHQVVDRALKGYRKINRSAFETVNPGGLVFTFSCSQAVSKDQFRQAVFTSAAQSKRRVRILHQLTQPADHPINIYHPEGEYLKGLVLSVE